jgi:hypothetical protein
LNTMLFSRTALFTIMATPLLVSAHLGGIRNQRHLEFTMACFNATDAFESSLPEDYQQLYSVNQEVGFLDVTPAWPMAVPSQAIGCYVDHLTWDVNPALASRCMRRIRWSCYLSTCLLFLFLSFDRRHSRGCGHQLSRMHCVRPRLHS